jgi:hypothetical protein
VPPILARFYRASLTTLGPARRAAFARHREVVSTSQPKEAKHDRAGSGN